MKRIILLLSGLFLLCFSYAFSQTSTGSIIGTVLDPEGKAVEFANVILNKAADSTLVKGEFTDTDGKFELVNIPAGTYWIVISYVGLPNSQTDVFELKEGQKLSLPTINMTPASTELAEVVVTAQRPLLEIKPDKMVFNVEGSVNASGSDAMELLRKAPGVIVDNNDNIALMGRNGVQIYIDGKPSPLSGSDLATYLKTLQSTDIDAIEIITNPSAKYDAEGNAGIINIRLKKNKNLGANGNVTLDYSVGEVARYTGSINGNYRNKNMNLFGNYSYNDGSNTNFLNMYREQNGLVFDQRSLSEGSWQGHNFKLGADFFINDKNTVGIMVNGYNTDFLWKSSSRTPIFTSGSSMIDSVLIASSRNDGKANNYNVNLNYRFDDAKGKTWNLDADYGIFENNGLEYQPNSYKDATETEMLQERIYRNETPTDINIATFKIDHERPLFGGQLGTGAKFSYVTTDNTFHTFNVINGENILDQNRSNQFDYTENVNAIYANYGRQLNSKLNIQAGIRMERTNSTGDLTALHESDEDYVERHYIDFFPSGGITYTLNQKNTFQLNYSRRINRPSYQDLNPFLNRMDELTFEKGNPFLKPEYANSIQLTHSWNYKLTTSLSYSHTKDLITRIIDTSGVTGSYITWLNLAKQETYSLNVSAPIPVTDWWSMFTTATGFYSRNQADYGDGKTINLDVKSFNLYSQQTFKLPYDISLEVSGFYSSPSLWGGTFEMDAMWSIDAGVQKKVLGGKGNLRLSVSDIFKTQEWYGRSQFGALVMDIHGGWDSRRLKVNFSYMFGNSQVKAARNRSTGLEDEQNRIKSDN